MAWDWRVDADMGGSLGTIDLAPWMYEWTLFAGKNIGAAFGAFGIPAVLQIALENEDGRFSRTNPGSPYAMHLNGGGLVDMHIPGSGRLIRARLAPFTAESSQGRSTAKLTAYGALRELQTSEGVIPPLREVRTDRVVQRVARGAGLQNRYIYLNDGTRTMPYFWAERSRNFDIAQGPVMFEGGALLDHRDYGVVFEPRSWRTTSPNDEIRARLGGADGYRVASFDDSGEFDVVINTATVPYNTYSTGAVGTLYDWSGALLIPAYGFLLDQAGGYLLQQDGGKFIVQEPVEQEFRVEITSRVPSAVDWSSCVLTVTASVGDISSECSLVGRSPTEAVVSIPRRDATYTVTAIRVTGPIIARDVAGQEPFRDPISIAELGGEFAPEVVPSWHDDRLEARQLATDMVIGFKSQGLVATVGFWLRGRAQNAWRRWISDAVAVDLVTREQVRIESNGVIEQLRLHQQIGSDPYGEWTLSGLYRELPDSTTVVMPPINDVEVIAGTQLAATLPEAMGGSGSFDYILTGAPSWVSRTGFMLGGTAPDSIGSDTLTWSATDTSSGTTISRSFRITKTGIVLTAPANLRASGILNNQFRLSWNAVADATRYEYRYAQGSAAPTGAWTNAGTATSVLITGLSRVTQYTLQVRAVGTTPYLTSSERQLSVTTANVQLDTPSTLRVISGTLAIAASGTFASRTTNTRGLGAGNWVDVDGIWAEIRTKEGRGQSFSDSDPWGRYEDGVNNRVVRIVTGTWGTYLSITIDGLWPVNRTYQARIGAPGYRTSGIHTNDE
ncbi:MAG: fibronectin type III domain-containing protein [Gammaproteobacteria bacterium]|nr:fibronectin type III domain-containing protein [Gammaproteobacteria bacterium]